MGTMLDKEKREPAFSPICDPTELRDPEVGGKDRIICFCCWPIFLYVKCCC